MLPLVSVIMPSYNGEKFINKSIESILEQTYKNFELIIVEDCSKDNSLEIIKKYIDNRIKLIVNNENRGIAYSTNLGISIAQGKYIALLDDDDLSTSNRLELQVEYLENNEDIDILGGRTITINENDEIIMDWGTPRSNPNFIKAKLLFENIDFGNGSVMIRKNFIEKNNLSYKDNYFGMQDFRFFMESSKVGKISSIDVVLLKNRIHSNRETNKNKNVYRSERAKLYANIQKDSLEMSGFILDENEMKVINQILCEGKIVGSTLEEWNRLYVVFKKILEQAKNMKIDFYSELETFCKQKLRRLYNQINLFENI